MEMILPTQVKTAMHLLHSFGYEAFVVGGAVRDFVMGRIPQDYDITTSATPQETLKVFSAYHCIETGLQHGTVLVVLDGVPIEITTYRTETGYSDFRHPDQVSFSKDVHEDLKRRDFTMNALAYDGDAVLDDFNGISDINNRIVRTVGNAEKRFQEDALRILRALRFSATLAFAIESECAKEIHRQKNSLSFVSKERITEELMKLLCGNYVENVILQFSDVLDVFLPGVEKMNHFEQHNAYHIYDVLTHTAKTVSLCSPKPILRLSALLHDIGKPQCYQEEESGYRHFKGHPEKSYELTLEIANHLALSNRDKDLLLFLVRNHDEPIEGKYAVKKWLSIYGVEKMMNLSELKIADADTHAEKAIGRVKMAKELAENLYSILENHECFSTQDLAVSGFDLLNAGYVGKEINDKLEEILDLVMQDKLANERDAILETIKK